MDDTISRKAAIEALYHVDEYNGRSVEAIRNLPSSEPQIIYCGDCKYKDDGIDEDGIPFLKCLHGRSYGGTRINDFCSWAERREVNNESD